MNFIILMSSAGQDWIILEMLETERFSEIEVFGMYLDEGGKL